MQDINNEFFEIWREVSQECKERYKIEAGNNAAFVGENIFNKAEKGDFFVYAECGVYKGTTFLPIYHLCKRIFKDFAMYALDSFSGFPEDAVLNENDEFEKFEMLFREGRITKEHLERARERCAKLPDKEHLRNEYFQDYADKFFEKCVGKAEIRTVKCSFNDLGSNFTNARDRFDLVFIDSDLYLSYKYCLDFFQKKTDMFIFDEYYSLKYPGARIACDEFVSDNQVWKYFNKIETNPYFERWGISMNSKKEE